MAGPLKNNFFCRFPLEARNAFLRLLWYKISIEYYQTNVYTYIHITEKQIDSHIDKADRQIDRADGQIDRANHMNSNADKKLLKSRAIITIGNL